LLEASFSAPVQTVPGAHPSSYTVDTGLFLVVKRPRHGVNLPTPSSVEVKERVELYLYLLLASYPYGLCAFNMVCV
jgi:hypothetical protein